MNILISGVGGPTPRSIARSIKFHSQFSEANLIGTDINPLAHGLYEDELYHHTEVIPRAGAEGYWSALEQLVEEHQIDVAMVHPELEVLAWARRKQEGKPLPCKALLPDYKLASLLVDKSKMTRVLKNSGLVPASITIDPANLDFESIEKQLSYPFWIRSTSGSSGLGSLKVEDRSALENWITINPDVGQFIGSTYLPGRNLACKLLYHEGKLLRAACAERVEYIMAKVAPSGITGNTSFGRLLNEPDLIETASRAMDILFEATNSPKHGFFTADFKEDEHGKPHLTEINIRMVAFNLSFAAGGANFSEDILHLLTDEGETNFDKTYQYKMYEFEKDLIFLRDVDAEPILMKETELKIED